MTNNNEKETSDLQSSIGIGPGSKGKSPGSSKVDQDKQATPSGSERSKDTDEDQQDTAGGREGNFADSERGDEDEWSPGSNQPSDQ